MYILIIILFTIIAFRLSYQYNVKVEKHCDLHKWVYRGEPGNEYLVCSVCRYLPGGEYKEENPNDKI